MRKIEHQNKIIALIIPADFQKDGLEFFTPNDFSQQLAYMKHPKGKLIDPHIHNLVIREVHLTQEVLIIRKGKIRVDLYSDNLDFLESVVLIGGDVILLASGGHGFEMLEETEMIEVKQGPYAGENDKIRFEGINTKIKS